MEQNLRGITSLRPILVAMLWAGFAFCILEVVIGALTYAGVQLPDGLPGTTLYDTIMIFSFLLLIATFFVFGRWVWVASKNLWDHFDMDFSPASNIWWHIVPIMNLFKPFEAMKEIWTKSTKGAVDYSNDAPTHMNIWWGCWVVSNIIANIAFRIDDFEFSLLLSIGSSAISIGSYYFVIQLVSEITEAQENGIGGTAAIFS